MFHREVKKAKSTVTKPRSALVAVLSVEQLLEDKKRQALLQHMSDRIALDPALFRKIGTSLIHQVTRYAQNLPETSLYYAHRGGWLDRALNRTEAALQLTRHLLIQDSNQEPSEIQKLWLYAVFSAGMLQSIGALWTDYRVALFDAHGHYIKPWQPFLEDLSSVGHYYDYDLLRGDDASFRNGVTPLLARQLMPTAGFTWIASHPEVFAVWLALLQEHRDSTGPLAAIFDRANAIALQRDLSAFLDKQVKFGEGRVHRIGTFVDAVPESSPDRERLMGAEFMMWLTQSLDSGKIVLNQPPMLMEIVPSGLVMSPQVFDMFVQEHRKFKNKVAVQQAFLAWNAHLLTDAVKASLQDKTDAAGAIPLDMAILPEKVTVYQAATGKRITVSSLALMHNKQGYQRDYPAPIQALPHLSSAGQWVMDQENVVGLQPRSSPHG